MGAGSFFQKFVNPIGGGPLGQIAGGKLNPLIGPVAWAGKNSFLAKESAYDPVAQFLNPGARAAGQAWLARQAPPAGYQAAGPWAGGTPSLIDAQGGYQTPGSSGSAAPTPPATTPRPADAPLPQRVSASGAPGVTSLGSGFSPAIAASQRAQRIGAAANPWTSALGGY